MCRQRWDSDLDFTQRLCNYELDKTTYGPYSLARTLIFLASTLQVWAICCTEVLWQQDLSTKMPVSLAPNPMAKHNSYNNNSYPYDNNYSKPSDDEDDDDDEDWRKLKDIASRRRIQNRISQRKRRVYYPCVLLVDNKN